MPKITTKDSCILYGKTYCTVSTSCETTANIFMTDNPEYGMLKEEDGRFHMALLTDEGSPKE